MSSLSGAEYDLFLSELRNHPGQTADGLVGAFSRSSLADALGPGWLRQNLLLWRAARAGRVTRHAIDDFIATAVSSGHINEMRAPDGLPTYAITPLGQEYLRGRGIR